MMRNIATIGACAIILLGSTAFRQTLKAAASVAAQALVQAATLGALAVTPAAPAVTAGGTGGQSNDVGGHGGPVGFATGQFAPSGTPPCQPGVCPGRSQ